MSNNQVLELVLDWFKCYKDKSMSRNNAETLMDDIVVAINKILATSESKPVAVIGNNFQLLYCREDWAKGLKVGDTLCLCTSPAAQPAPVQEPVGEAEPFSGRSADHTQCIFHRSNVPVGTKLYTTSPEAQRQWIGLTDEQIDKLFGDGPYVPAMLLRDVARAIESKLKEKNA
jgi:hypothetical protein